MRLALAPIVAQLQAAGFRNTEGVLAFSAQTTEPRALPALFVVPTDEAARDNAVAGARDQLVNVDFSVMICLDAARRNITGAADDLKDAIDKVVGALVGWTHPAAARPCDYVGGSLASAVGSVVVWRVRLRSRYHLRSAS